jgi:hypothetical protein
MLQLITKQDKEDGTWRNSVFCNIRREIVYKKSLELYKKKERIKGRIEVGGKNARRS